MRGTGNEGMMMITRRLIRHLMIATSATHLTYISNK